nr:retrovirus-related Pol polyprotein from transposon TNT 1-94 [Tanacetum cinerariifolium]
SDDGVTTSLQLSQNSRPPMLDHQDKYMMKAQQAFKISSLRVKTQESQGGIKDNDLKFKIQDHRRANNESKEFPRTQGSFRQVSFEVYTRMPSMVRNNLSSRAYDDSFTIWGVNLPTKISPVSTQDPSITISFLSKFWSKWTSTEAEYIALTEAVKEAIWLWKLLEELGMELNRVTVNCDNQGAIHLS